MLDPCFFSITVDVDDNVMHVIALSVICKCVQEDIPVGYVKRLVLGVAVILQQYQMLFQQRPLQPFTMFAKSRATKSLMQCAVACLETGNKLISTGHFANTSALDCLVVSECMSRSSV